MTDRRDEPLQLLEGQAIEIRAAEPERRPIDRVDLLLAATLLTVAAAILVLAASIAMIAAGIVNAS